MEQVVESNLRMRRNREFLWVSRESKTIYLKAHESCLTLYFPVYEDLFVYMTKMIKKGYVVGQINTEAEKGSLNECMA